jgi:hypothetical protein
MNILRVIACGWLTALPALGLVVFDADTRTLVVSDFPEAMPARLETLARADRANGWGLLEFEAATQTWKIRANLQIGCNDGSETWMQIGCVTHTNETLLLDGNLILSPYLVIGENNRYTPQRMNRLTMGNPTNAAIRTVLKITAGHTIYSGKLPSTSGTLRNGYGGELHIYHGVLTSASGRRDIARPYWSGFLALDHAVVSGFNAPALFGTAWSAKLSRTDICDSIFEDNAGVFGAPAQRAIGCLFRRNTVVIQGLAGNTVQLIGCQLNDNVQNWQLGSGGTVELVDCVINPGSKPDSYGFNGSQPARVVSRRHVIVKTVNVDGTPVGGVKIIVAVKPGGDSLIFNNYIETGSDGCTAGIGNQRALLLTEFIAEATETNAPKIMRYCYDIEATAKSGASGRIESFVPRQSWETILLIVK